MAYIRTDDSHYKSIASKIREKTGLPTTYKPYEMSNGIEEVYGVGYEVGKSDEGLVLQAVLDKTIVDLYSESTTSIKAHTLRECSKLRTASFPNLTGEINGYAFYYCTALESVYFPNAATFLGTQAFASCSKLKHASFPKISYINGDPFLNSGVEVVDFGNIQTIFAQPFQGCSAFKALILRRSGVCTLSQSNAFAGTNIASGTAHIYVPKSLVDSYKAATNWSNYASQIRAIEDYPDITGG